MNNPSPIRARLAEAVIGVAIVACAWWTVARPVHDRVAQAHQRAADAQAMIDGTGDTGGHDRVGVERIRDRVHAWSDALADTLSAGACLQRAADGAGVRIDRLVPAEKHEAAARGRIATSTRRFEVVASGTAQALCGMLDRVALAPLAIVRSFEMVPGPGANEVVAVIVIETIGITIAEMQDTESDS